MPALSSVSIDYQVCTHTSAADFLEATEHVLLEQEQERRSNLILAHALERVAWEASNGGLGSAAATTGLTPHERLRVWWTRQWSGTQSTTEIGRDFWVTVWTVQTPVASSSSHAPAPSHSSFRPPKLDFAVSVLGSDPVFVFTPYSPATLDSNFLNPRINLLVLTLARCVPVQRMSRVFAPSPVAECFAGIWVAHTRAQPIPESQCNAFSTFCTVATFAGVRPLAEGHRARIAESHHARQLARMYYDYEQEMVLHPISHDFARSKIEHLIQSGQLWIYEYPVLDDSSGQIQPYYQVAAMAVLTRHTPTIAALSTIYTLPSLRRQGFAERLVGRICHRVFAMNKSAVLFVPEGKVAAGNLLGRTGFYGMGRRAQQLGERAEKWREIGFAGGIRVAGSW